MLVGDKMMRGFQRRRIGLRVRRPIMFCRWGKSFWNRPFPVGSSLKSGKENSTHDNSISNLIADLSLASNLRASFGSLRISEA